MTLIWSPDSCWCKYEITSDDEKLTLVKVLHKCLEHENMGDTGAFNSAWNKGKGINQQPGKTPSEKATEKLIAKEATKNV